MAIEFSTSTPRKLLKAYKKAIDDGHIVTWQYDSDGDFTHSTDQWINKAWLRPNIIPEKSLIFNIISPEDQTVSSSVYAIYHGRFIESFLRHCDQLFDKVLVTALADGSDAI